MGPSGGFSGSEHPLEGSNSNSTGISSLSGDHGDGALGTAREKTKRKARKNWSDESTQQLLDAMFEFEEPASTSKGRRRMRARPKWEIVAESVNGMTAKECQGRSETLTKSFYRIKEHCDVHQKPFNQLTEEDFIKLDLPAKMEENWYYQLVEIKEPPKKAMRVSHPDSGDQIISSSHAPASVMAQGPEDDTIGVVGTREPACAERDPPRSTSPTDLQSHSGAEPAHAHAHSHQHVNQCIAAAADAAEPPHLPPVDLRNHRTATVDATYVPSQTDVWGPQGFDDQSPQHPSHQFVRYTGHDSDKLTTNYLFDYTFPDVEGPSDFEQILSAEIDDDDDEEEDVGLVVRLWEDSF